jgi:pimeloyl-ACP methyl ester carboxylesterase
MSRLLLIGFLGLLGCAGLAGCTRSPEATQAPVAEVADGTPRAVTSADGVEIQYRAWGRGETAVVLVHGWTCDSGYWSAQLEDLRARYTVVTLDLAGHGVSGHERSEWTMGHFGDDVAAVVAELPHEKVVLVGHSMGGPVVLEAAARIGPRVVGVIGVDTFKSIGEPPQSPERMAQRLQVFRDDFPGTTRVFVSQQFFRPGSDPQLVQKVANGMAAAPPDIAIAAIEGLNAMDYAAVLPSIRMPIVAINADYGEFTDVARIRQSAPAFRAVVLEGTGHFLMLEAPERFNPVLLQELAALTGEAEQA